jgi:hypothetical protein
VRSVDWFERTLEKRFGIKAELNQVGVEAYLLSHDEIDDSLIPKEDLDKLPDPAFVEMLNYMDEEDHEWIAGIVIDQATKDWLYEIWIKNGERIFNRFFG